MKKLLVISCVVIAWLILPKPAWSANGRDDCIPSFFSPGFDTDDEVTFTIGPTQAGGQYVIEVDCKNWNPPTERSPVLNATGGAVSHTFEKIPSPCLFNPGRHWVSLYIRGWRDPICTSEWWVHWGTQPPGPPTGTLETYDPCQGIKDPDEYEKCHQCNLDGGSYTALGCLPNDPREFVIWILGRAIGIGGGIAFLLMIFGGFQVLTSAGNPERLSSGKDIIGSALAGLLLIIFSLFILELIGVDILGLESVGFKFGG